MKNFVLHLAAKNNANGNPRRIYVIYDEDGCIVEVIDEGYRGAISWYEKYPNAQFLGRYETTPRQRRELLKLKPNNHTEVRK